MSISPNLEVRYTICSWSSTNITDEYEMSLELKFETARQYFIRIPFTELTDRALPDVFINAYQNKKSKYLECQTLDLVKLNQKILDSHHEVIKMSDKSIQDLISDIRGELHVLFKISEAIAVLDMIASFGQVVTTQEYVRPELTATFAIKAGRHPIHEKIHHATKFIPNDVYATESSRFQIITGCNMSGKSTYIRSIALMTVMAQIGCFVPATYASFQIRHSLFARVTASDAEISANVSTFSAEMREMAFILRNITPHTSMIVIDELGRGTATTDGLHIALAISEALLQSFSLVWFATHFHDLARILSPRPGVVNMHLAVQMPHPQSPTSSSPTTSIKMLYKVSPGPVKDMHYGLTLARVLNLPAPLIEHAATVSNALTRLSEAKREKETARALAIAKRRKLILGLNEQLKQARDSNMQGEELRSWLKRLQDEFVLRMGGIETGERIGVGGAGGRTVRGKTTDTWSVVESDSHGENESEVMRGKSAEGEGESLVEIDRHGNPVETQRRDADFISSQEEAELRMEKEIEGEEDLVSQHGHSMDLHDNSPYEEEEWFDADADGDGDGEEYEPDEDKEWLRSN
jgi:DNA mismatch repair protein MSH4